MNMNLTTWEQEILISLYQKETRKNGKIDLPPIQALVNQYQEGEIIPSQPTPETTPSCPNNPQPSFSYTKINSDNPTTYKTNVTNVPPPENQPVKIEAEIINEDREKKAPIPEAIPVSNEKIPIDPLQIERIILELQLMETAQNLSKPPNKRLKSPHLGEIEKRLNQFIKKIIVINN